MEQNHLAEVQRLIQLGASPSRAEEDGETYLSPLENAIGLHHFAMVRYMVEHGASRYNSRTHDDCLNIAAAVGSPEILEYLMQQFPEHDKATLLYSASGGNYASYWGGNWRIENVKYLLSHGAQRSINTAVIGGQRAVHRSANREFAECLFNHGAQLNVRDRFNNTPLHFAAAKGDLELVKFYVEHGLNVDDINTTGETALSVAISFRRQKVVEYLKAHGAH